MFTASALKRFFHVIVASLITVLLTGLVTHRLIRTDLYVKSSNDQKLRLVPPRSFGLSDLPLIGRLFRQRNCENVLVVQTKTPQMLFEHWQVYHKPGFQMISAWGAFLDTRAEAGRVVRIFAVSQDHKDKMVLCQLWSSDETSKGTLLAVTNAESKVIGRGHKRNKVQYYEYLYTCHVPSDFTPQNVSLVFERCENSTISLPVITPEKPEKYSHQYGICVAAAYNRIPPGRLIEWIEMNKLLGVTEINIYNSNLFSDTLDIFKHYQSEGLVKIHNAPPPLPSWDYWPRKLAVISGLNDCMYRNMYRYNHTIVIDFDEVIVPLNQLTYDEMFKEVYAFHKGQVSNRPALEFRNAYFFLEVPTKLKPGEKSPPMALFYPRYRQKSKISRPGYSVKSITNPRRCIVMMNHYCRVTLPGHEGKFSLHVDPKFALNQHYKNCHLGMMECKNVLNETTQDDNMLRYLDHLTGNVKKQYKKLNIDFN